MGSLKTLSFAGAVAMVATSAALVTPAAAADLMPPPMVAPAPPPMIDAGISGLYLRGDVGVGKLNHDGFHQPEVAAAPGGHWLRTSLGDTALMGVGVGYQVNSFLRFDVTGEYRTAASLSGVDGYNFFCTFAGGSCPAIGTTIRRNNFWSGKMSSFVVLANAYADLGTWNGLTPFIGAGVGGAYNRIFGVTDFDPSDLGGGGYATDRSKWNFAWALHAGLAYDVTSNVKVELAYRYLNLGNVATGGLNCLSPTGAVCGYGPLTVKSVSSSDVKLGVRWLLADRAMPVAMPAGPLIRKY
ncbi:MAG TPA: outer membrane beta-barrel protein [Beijerinckiaceae bacterium]|nr:outer membrane beta-barrel protein [Beijerinckiaceae bacterium]